MNNTNNNQNSWMPTVGYEGYLVSLDGEVASFRRGKREVLTPKDNGSGYLQVGLRDKHGETKWEYVHRLVLTAFVGQPLVGQVCDHWNGNRHDNRLSNLRWCSQKENCNNPNTIERYRKANSKPLHLQGVSYPHLELSFPSCQSASRYFAYKNDNQLSVKISEAKKEGNNFITIKGEDYYFVLEDKGGNKE